MLDLSELQRMATALEAERANTRHTKRTRALIADAARVMRDAIRMLRAIDQDAEFCERHPELPWPHDDCPGPGVPREGLAWCVLNLLVKERQKCRGYEVMLADAYLFHRDEVDRRR